MGKSELWMAGVAVLAAVTARAAEPAATATLDEVLTQSLQKNASVYRARKVYEDRLADGIEAEAPDNPELQADAVRRRGEDGTGVEIELTQPHKLSQLSGARLRYADYLREAASTEQRYEILKVMHETTALYARLWLLQERRKLYEESAKEAEGLRQLVRSAAGLGQTSVAASQLFSADAAKLESDLGAIEAELRLVRTDLAKLTGHSFAHAELQRPAFFAVPDSTEALVGFAKDRANVRNVLKARLKAAEERASIAKQDAVLPEFGPRLLYLRSPGGDEESYGVGVQLRIPLWNQNDAERTRAEADLKQVRSEADLFANLPPEEAIAELQQSAIALQNRADRYFDTILPAYRESYAVTRSMLRQGQTDALQVWQVREKLYQTENEALAAVVEAINARGALELELGGKLEEIQ